MKIKLTILKNYKGLKPDEIIFNSESKESINNYCTLEETCLRHQIPFKIETIEEPKEFVFKEIHSKKYFSVFMYYEDNDRAGGFYSFPFNNDFFKHLYNRLKDDNIKTITINKKTI